MTPPAQSLSLLLRHAAAAHATGATTPAELEAAVVAAKVLADALTPPKPEAAPSRMDVPAGGGGDAAEPDGRSSR